MIGSMLYDKAENQLTPFFALLKFKSKFAPIAYCVLNI